MKSIGLALCGLAAFSVQGEVNKVETVAPDVFFHEGDIGRKGHCNNGWIVFDDFVLVVDGNFPSGALEVIPKIKAQTDKPIRFAFDTHHHGDHAYGNQVWANHGAVPVAHIGVIEEMNKYEPGRWNDAAKGRPDVASSALKRPTLLFKQEMIFDDGKHRVELLHFGVAHTRGDGFAWLPKEKILFTGDACVNGPYNYVGDGNIGQWIETLEKVKKLGAVKVCPGHGPTGGGELIEEQQTFFIQLRDEAKKLVGKPAGEMATAVEEIKQRLKQNEKISRYIGGSFSAQVEKALVEAGGKAFMKTSSRTGGKSDEARAGIPTPGLSLANQVR